MENLLENTRKAVEKYHSKQAGDRVKATKAVLSAIVACRKYIEENEQEDRGIAQRFARELSEVLAVLPMFRNFASDKKALHNIHTKKLADEHLEMIQKDLEESVKNLELNKKRKIHEWVKTHPVLGKLRRSASKKLPQGAYILLFRSAGGHSGRHRRPEKRAAATVQPKEGNGHFGEGTIPLGNDAVENEVGVVDGSVATEIVDHAQDVETEHHEVAASVPDAGATVLESDVPVQANLEECTEAGAEEAAVEAPAEESATEATLETGEEKAGQTEPSQSALPPSEQPVLVLRPAPEGKVFTRFRPKEFSDDLRVYRMFRGGPPLVGACIIAEGKLVSAIGTLPQQAGRDQLRLLVSLSKEAVGKPGRDFVESNYVLNEIFQMYRSREIHKDAYVLLFQYAADDDDDAEGEEAGTNGGAPDTVVSDSQPEEPTESQAENVEVPAADGGESDAIADTSEETTIQHSETEQVPESVEIETHDHESNVGEDSNGTEETESGDTDLESDLNDDPSEDSEPEHRELELVSKRTEDGRVITRFRNFDFNDSRTLYEGFKNRRPIVGAAIIKERELIKTIGEVPEAEGQRQLDLLLRISNQALEKPALEFIETNEVLDGLYKLSTTELKDRDCSVVLFTEVEGKPTVMSLPDRKGKMISKLPIADFRIPKFLHDRFKKERLVIGASVISQQAPSAPPPRDYGDRGHKGKGGGKSESTFRPRSAPAKPPVVLAAYGRTPLKQNVLLSAEILKRLGVDPSILY